MKRIFLIIIVAFSTLLLSKTSNATHVAAGDIYYEYVSPLKYKVHLVLYRDCKPGNSTLFSTDIVYAESISKGYNIPITVDTTGNNTNKMYGDLCPNISNWCVDPNSIFPGYEEWHYTGEITLPDTAKDWVFRWDLCCRNNAISNITGTTPNSPGSLSMCISAGLNNVVRPINNSPKLSIKPIPYVCVNQPKTYLNGPVDPDLDSVFFTSETPLGLGACAPVNWVGTASASNPLGAAAPGGYVIDPVTGTATFTPTAINTYVMAFKCWDIDPNTGDTVGYTTRDVQINVLSCNAAPPSATNLTQNYQVQNLQGANLQSTTPLALTVCPGTPMSFDVQAVSNSGSNNILTTANNTISCPGSNYTFSPIGGGNPVTGTFTWTPTANDIGNHTLIIEFKDSTCTVAQPIVLKSYCVVQIKVLPGVDAGPDLYYCSGLDSVQFFVTAPAGITNWQWTDINGNTSNLYLSDLHVKKPFAAPITTTIYVVEALNPPIGITCKTKDTVAINVDLSNTINATVSSPVICAPGLVTLSATPSGVSPIYQCGEENVSCSGANLPYVFGTGTSSGANNTPFGFNSNAGGRFQLLYTAAELNAAGITKGRINGLAFDVITKNSSLPYNITMKMGCVPITTLNGFTNAVGFKTVYINPQFNTVAGTNTINFTTPYVWDGSSNIVLEICYYNGQNNFSAPDEIAFTTMPNVQFYGEAANSGGCNIPSPLIATTGVINTNDRPNFTFYICDVPVKPWKYEWTPSNYIFDSSAAVTTAYVDQSKTFYVHSRAGNNCVVNDSVTVIVSTHGLTVTPKDTVVCFGDAFQAAAYGYGSAPNSNFYWYNVYGGSGNGLSCQNCQFPIITTSTLVDSLFACVRTDNFGCADTQYVHINMLAVPNVNIINGDSITINYLQEVNLIATGAQLYNWTPVWGSSNPNVSNTIVQPSEPTTYYVYGINEFGCSDVDSIIVNINYNQNLFVPSAFTPNNDGKNDVFKVVNLTFQAIQEFKIVNRWGTEIFNARDNRGWNGTYKGKDQDPDVYFYYIKVAMPDGPSKVFKGDVTLIR